MLLNLLKWEMDASTETPLSQDEQCSHTPELPQVSPWLPVKGLSWWHGGYKNFKLPLKEVIMEVNLIAEKILLTFQCTPDT